jgi:hypothetical protein
MYQLKAPLLSVIPHRLYNYHLQTIAAWHAFDIVPIQSVCVVQPLGRIVRP